MECQKNKTSSCKEWQVCSGTIYQAHWTILEDGLELFKIRLKYLGGDSQNFLHKFVRFVITLGIKILRLFRLNVLIGANIIKGWC